MATGHPILSHPYPSQPITPPRCVNTLSMECQQFYLLYGKAGDNYTRYLGGVWYGSTVGIWEVYGW